MNSQKLSFLQNTLFLILFCAATSLPAMEKETSSSKLTSQSIIHESALLNATMCNNELAVTYWINLNTRVNTSNAYNGFSPLHFAAVHGNTTIGKMLLDKKALINAQDRDGDTPLHVAINEEHISFIELLLTHGAQHNIRNNDKKTVAHLVVANMLIEDKPERKRLSKIHSKLLTAHMKKSIWFC